MQLFMLAAYCLCATVAQGGIITHDLEGADHERATSYQNIQIEHFHAVPTYIRKEHKQLLEHPISLGKSSSKVEIHHGDKHDYGYAIASVDSDLHGQGGAGYDFGAEGHSLAGLDYGGLGETGHVGLDQHAALAAAAAGSDSGHEEAYQVQDQADYSQVQGHGFDAAQLAQYQSEYSGYHQ